MSEVDLSGGIDFAPLNNPKGVNPLQRERMTRYIREGLMNGTVDGIDLLTKEEANKILVEVEDKMRQEERKKQYSLV